MIRFTIMIYLSMYRFPISNDPLYNSDIFGAEKGKGGLLTKSKERFQMEFRK